MPTWPESLMAVMPPEARAAHNLKWNVIPIRGRSMPLVGYREFFDTRITVQDLTTWASYSGVKMAHAKGHLNWAVLTGRRGTFDMIVLDVDLPDGPESLERMGLEPNGVSPSGGQRCLIKNVGVDIKTGSVMEDYPGITIKGHHSSCILWGQGKDDGSRIPYVCKDLEAYEFADLAEDVQAAILECERGEVDEKFGFEVPEDWTNFVSEDWLLDWAINKKLLDRGTREGAGFDLACQLRDEQYAYGDAVLVMMEYHRQVNAMNLSADEYRADEALGSLGRAYELPPREPMRWSKKPQLVIDGDAFENVSSAIDLLVASNDPPYIFGTNAGLAVVQDRYTGLGQAYSAETRLVEVGMLAGLIDEHAQVGKPGKNGLIKFQCPNWIAERILGRDLRSVFPPLAGVARSPKLLWDGTVVSENGYNAETATFMALEGKWDELKVSCLSRTSAQDLARDLIMDLTCDFNFDGEESRTNYLALLLTPFMRDIIDANTPLFIMNGRMPGVGKGKLVEMLSWLAFGQPAENMSWSREEAELQKVIAAAMARSQPMMFFDNIRTGTEISAPLLEQALTARTYTGRVLGTPKIGTWRNDAIWILTGNNITPKGDLARRTVTINLTSRSVSPHLRDASSFRHPNIVKYVRDHRVELVGQLLTLVKSWLADEAWTRSAASMGSFEEWSVNMGGLMEWLGFGSFNNSVGDPTYFSEDTTAALLAATFDDTDERGGWLPGEGVTGWGFYQICQKLELQEGILNHVVVKNTENSSEVGKAVGAWLRGLVGRPFVGMVCGEERCFRIVRHPSLSKNSSIQYMYVLDGAPDEDSPE